MSYFDLQEMLALQEASTDVFQSVVKPHRPIGARGVFGGALVGQSLHAAILTVGEGFVPHSLHSYFLAAATGDIPLTYKVDRLRDGRTFQQREVRAFEKDQLVFILTTSFCLKNLNELRRNPPQLTLTKPTPRVSFADFVKPRIALKWAIESGKEIAAMSPEKHYARFYDYRKKNGPVDFLVPLNHYELLSHEDHEDHHKKDHEIVSDVYGKVYHPITKSYFHYIAFAYYSDMYILSATMRNHRRPYDASIINLSLDHSMYFHKEFDANQWLLFRVGHPRAIDSRMIGYGELYDDHELCATVVQEGFVVIGDDLKAKL